MCPVKQTRHLIKKYKWQCHYLPFKFSLFWGGGGNIALYFFDSNHTSWNVYLCMKAYRLTSGNISTFSVTTSKLPFSLLQIFKAKAKFTQDKK